MNQVKTIITSLLLVSVLVPARSQSRVYENKKANYEVTVPKLWAERVDSLTTDFIVPDEGEFDVWQEFIGISLAEANGLSLQETFAFYMNEDFPSYYTNFKVVKQGEETINGLYFKWALYSFSNSNDEVTLYNLLYLGLKKDTLYSINAIAEKNGYSKLEPTYLEIIRSFQLKP